MKKWIPWVVVGGLLFVAVSASASEPVTKSKPLTREEAIALAQEFVMSPDWAQSGLMLTEGVPLNRPFGEYRSWEAVDQGNGSFKVIARHLIVGPTEFLVTANRTVAPLSKGMTLATEFQQKFIQ